MTRRRKHIYFAMMAAGALAMVVDRVVIGERATGPVPAMAAGVPVSARLSPAASVAVAPAVPAIAFPRNLPPFQPQAGLRDLFALPAIISSERKRQRDTDNDGHKRTDEQLPERADRKTFSSRHQLHAILVDQRLKIAIVDGQWMRKGQVLDGCKLSEIRTTEAVFMCQDGDAILAVVTPRILDPH